MEPSSDDIVPEWAQYITGRRNDVAGTFASIIMLLGWGPGSFRP